MARLLTLLIALLLAVNVHADIIHLQELSLDYKSFFQGGSDPLITENGLSHGLDKELNLNVNLDIGKYIYWDSIIHSDTDQNGPNLGGQFRLVGLESRLGVYVTDFIEFGYYHYSQHLLDYEYPYGHFPVKDSVEIKLYFFRTDNPHKGIF